MRRIYLLFAAVLMSIAWIASAQATPQYYTFSGTVSYVSDATGIIKAAGISKGVPVSYTFQVNYTLPGYSGSRTLSDVTSCKWDYCSYTDYFWADYIDGSALKDSNSTDLGKYSYGENYWDNYKGRNFIEGILIGGTQNSRVELYAYSYVQNWNIGTTVFGYNYAYDSKGAYSTLSTNMTLTSISAKAPVKVPEPSTILLFGSGLVGLAGLRRRLRFRS